MTAGVIETSPTPLMAAIEENLAGHVSFVQRELADMTVDERPELLIVDSGLDSDTFNKILQARLADAQADEHIERAVSHFRDSGRPFTWWVGPCSRPLDLEARLEAHGLRAAEHELGMTIDLDDVRKDVDVPPGVEIQRVTTAEALSDFAGVLAGLTGQDDQANAMVAEFFERSAPLVLEKDAPMRFYVAYADGEPAAVSELFVTGSIAGVHMVATREAFRRRGLGMALTWTALDEGRRLGMKTGALQAAPEGQSVYERLGFRPCGRFVEYAPAA